MTYCNFYFHHDFDKVSPIYSKLFCSCASHKERVSWTDFRDGSAPDRTLARLSLEFRRAQLGFRVCAIQPYPQYCNNTRPRCQEDQRVI